MRTDAVVWFSRRLRCIFCKVPVSVLHVVADLVGDHVGLREIARRVEAPSAGRR